MTKRAWVAEFAILAPIDDEMSASDAAKELHELTKRIEAIVEKPMVLHLREVRFSRD